MFDSSWLMVHTKDVHTSLPSVWVGLTDKPDKGPMCVPSARVIWDCASLLEAMFASMSRQLGIK